MIPVRPGMVDFLEARSVRAAGVLAFVEPIMASYNKALTSKNS